MSRIVRAVPTLAAAMPGGVALEPAVWGSRHRWILRLLWVQIIPVALFSMAGGYGVRHTLIEVFPIAMLAYLGSQEWVTQRTRSVVTGIGLMTVSAMLVHLSGGITEMHFHFFVMLGVISLYQDWRPFLYSIAFVALHHASSARSARRTSSTTRTPGARRSSGPGSTPSWCWPCRPCAWRRGA